MLYRQVLLCARLKTDQGNQCADGQGAKDIPAIPGEKSKTPETKQVQKIKRQDAEGNIQQVLQIAVHIIRFIVDQ